MDNSADFLTSAIREYRRLKELAERAMTQIDDPGFFASSGPEPNSIAVIVKHMAGNMRSRWTDFLTTDGEKPDRHRDTEFEIDGDDSRDGLMRRWEDSWRILFDALEPLAPDDLHRTITIRGEEHSVMQAIFRQLSHYAYHVGQIVHLAREAAGSAWSSLSVPRGKSEEFTRDVRARNP